MRVNKDDLEIIEVKQEFSFVAVKASKVNRIIKAVNNSRIKKKKCE